ncbi:tocopherol cyclase family protein [Streptomyces sp. NPDC046900]|uniref:tocopherol cyclase family protein n=1 Tax=Streptomyces sp. NPDC046900 TaxID=3155473 RepID=UPI0033C091BF
MEGYLWRFTDTGRRRVLVVACAVNHHRSRTWGSVTVAASPLSLVRSTTQDGARAASGCHAVRVPPALDFARDTLCVRFADVCLEATVVPAPARRTLLPAAGVFSLLPGLNHYWHPHLFDARVEGTVRLGEHCWDLSACEVYAEKSWGRGFPPQWWWGQAQGFDGGGIGVAFAGGLLGRGPVTVPVSGMVISMGGRRVHLFPPAAIVRGGHRAGRWRLTATGPRIRAELTGEAAGSPVLRLPLPSLTPHRLGHSTHHPVGTVHLRVLRGGRPVYSGSSVLAALETGVAPAL